MFYCLWLLMAVKAICWHCLLWFFSPFLSPSLLHRLPLQHRVWHGVRKDLRRADFRFVFVLRWTLASSHGSSQQRGQCLDACRGQQQGVHTGYYDTNNITARLRSRSPVLVISALSGDAWRTLTASLTTLWWMRSLFMNTRLAIFSSAIDFRLLSSHVLGIFTVVTSAEGWGCLDLWILQLCFLGGRNLHVLELFSFHSLNEHHHWSFCK